MADVWDDPLSALRWHWGDAYGIYHPEPDVWIAERRDTHETLRSDTSLGLRSKIIGDYFARPMSRAVSPSMPCSETVVQVKPSWSPRT